MKKLCHKLKYLLKLAFDRVNFIYTILGYAFFLISAAEILPTDLTPFIRALIGASIYAFILITILIIQCICFCAKEKCVVVKANNGNRVYVQYGDLFDPNIVRNPQNRRNIIIPVNRCFDTIVDNKLISDQSLHGAIIKKLLAGNKYTKESLDNKIRNALKSKECVDVSPEDKPAGNLKRYPVGTVVNIPGIDNEHYLLFALSKFDSELKASTSSTDYAIAIQKLINVCNSESQGAPVVLPLIGAKLARTNKQQSDILAFLVQSFKFNRDLINSDIHIVVKSDFKDDISIMDICDK